MAFFYDNTQSFESNFQRWWLSTQLESEVYKIPAYTEEQARNKFNQHFSKKKIKIIRKTKVTKQ